MSDIDIKQLIEQLTDLQSRATPGPWLVHPLMAWVSPASDIDMPICQMRMATEGETCEPQAQADAELIAKGISALPILLPLLSTLLEQEQAAPGDERGVSEHFKGISYSVDEQEDGGQ